MLRVLKNIVNRRLFHDHAAVHNLHAVTQLCNNPQIMRDKDNTGAIITAQCPHLLQDLILDRYIQRSGRFVRNQKIRTVRQGHSDHDPLAHAA